jgi:hypothetical protein
MFMDVKKGFLLLLIIAALCPLWAQQEKDVVLVVDTASSMFSYYNEVGTYLSGPFLAENVASGDTLHIISFGAKPRFEIARKIFGSGDIETASARIWLLYPLEPSSDSGAAISYAENYVRSIQGGRPKKVFIVSDRDLSGAANASAERLRPTEVRFIQASSRMSSGQAPAPARPPASSTVAPAAPARTPAQTTAPAASTGSTTAASAGTAPAVSSSGAESGSPAPAVQPAPVTEPSVVDPAVSGTAGTGTAGAGTVPAESSAGTTCTATGAAGGSNAAASAGATGASATGAIGSLGIPLPLLIGLLLLLLLAIILFIVFRMRSLHSSPKKVMAEFRSGGSAADAELLNSFASRQAEASLQGPREYRQRHDTNQFLTKPPMLNIFVEEQNTAIGRRNIHALKQGATYSVGGGNSDFLIFLVKFPANIGRLAFNGTNCTFTPLRSEYFPDIGSSPVTECIGKTIRVISKMNYEVFFHFEPYRDPLLVMNELLNSIKVPEPHAAE